MIKQNEFSFWQEQVLAREQPNGNEKMLDMKWTPEWSCFSYEWPIFCWTILFSFLVYFLFLVLLHQVYFTKSQKHIYGITFFVIPSNLSL